MLPLRCQIASVHCGVSILPVKRARNPGGMFNFFRRERVPPSFVRSDRGNTCQPHAVPDYMVHLGTEVASHVMIFEAAKLEEAIHGCGWISAQVLVAYPDPARFWYPTKLTVNTSIHSQPGADGPLPVHLPAILSPRKGHTTYISDQVDHLKSNSGVASIVAYGHWIFRRIKENRLAGDIKYRVRKRPVSGNDVLKLLAHCGPQINDAIAQVLDEHAAKRAA